jgi:SAM-dependent methyltransferase
VLYRARTAARLQRDRVGKHARALRARVFTRTEEADRATNYWKRQRDYHVGEDDPRALERSRFVADVIVPELGIKSLLELGCNNGRNLAVLKERQPQVKTLGLDVHQEALEAARGRGLGLEVRQQDVNSLDEPPKSWDAVLTMSVLDHIPDYAVEELAAKIAVTARYVIAVEVWLGKDEETAAYKYSRDYRPVFERHGARTLRWELSPGQFDTVHTAFWAYVGEFS